MTELFGRTCTVTVATDLEISTALKFTTLDISFKIEKSLKTEPNTCELQLWNLSKESRAAIEELAPPVRAGSSLVKKQPHQAITGIPVRIEAGYGDNQSLLWLGDLRTAKSQYQKPDWITRLDSGDGEKAWQNARVNVSYGPMTPVDVALRAMVRALGLGEGNLAQVAADLQLVGMGKFYTQGTVISGYVQQQLKDFCRSADLECSIQDGAVQFVDRGAALKGRAVHITPSTGMIGSPTVDVDGILHIQMQLIPDVRPGTLLVVDADRVKGSYRIEKATWTGERAGVDWKITCEAARI